MKKKFAENLHRAVFFTMKRLKKDGGFGATPKLPATIEDTYHGLKILDETERFCGLPENTGIEPELHAGFLIRFLDTRPCLGMKGAWQLVWCMNRCGLEAMAKKLASTWFLRSVQRNSEGLYYALRISTLMNIPLPYKYSAEELRAIAAFKGILFRRWMAIFIDKKTGAGLIDHTAAASWVRRCQNYDGGFGFLPGSTSYLENTHFALKALDFMKEQVPDLENAERFVLGCQTKNGGFSRKADAAPFLDATWHGTAALIYLDRQKRRKGSGT